MSQPDPHQDSTPSSDEVRAQDIRIDSPHPLPGQAAIAGGPSEVIGAATAAQEAALQAGSVELGGSGPAIAAGETLQAAQQLYRQTSQLAIRLQTRQEHLDRREAQLNARTAQLEQDIRTARLLLTEGEAEAESRRTELKNEHLEILQRLARLAAIEAVWKEKSDTAVGDLLQREDNLRQLTTALDLRERRLTEETTAHQAAVRQWAEERQQAETKLLHQQQQVEAQREASRRQAEQVLAGVEQRRQAVEAEAEQLLAQARTHGGTTGADPQSRAEHEALQARWHKLEQAEARLAEAQNVMEKLAAQVQDREAEVREDTRRQRQQMALEQRQAMEELQRQRTAVERRSEQTDQCQAALAQTRAELAQMHRETLEIRLATEELWVQLSATVPPAKVTRSLGKIRVQLSDHYRLAAEELKKQSEQFQQLRGEMAAEHAKLARQKQQFDQWAQRRENEFTQTMQRLASQQAGLDVREAQLDQNLQAWQRERLECQQEIYRLQRELTRDARVSVC